MNLYSYTYKYIFCSYSDKQVISLDLGSRKVGPPDVKWDNSPILATSGLGYPHLN